MTKCNAIVLIIEIMISYYSTDIIINAAKQTVTYTFKTIFKRFSELLFTTTFTGNHNDLMVGFYRSKYTDKKGNNQYHIHQLYNLHLRLMMTTQFEPTDARRAFPSFDEPSLKATFDIVMNVALRYTALSNMNVIKETIIPGVVDSAPLRSYTFATTPIMSTYVSAKL